MDLMMNDDNNNTSPGISSDLDRLASAASASSVTEPDTGGAPPLPSPALPIPTHAPLAFPADAAAFLPPADALLSELSQKNAEIELLKDTLQKQTEAIKRLQQDTKTKAKKKTATVARNKSAAGSTSQTLSTTAPGGIIVSVKTPSREEKWKHRFQQLAAFKLAHNHCNVPKSYRDKSLHSWVRKQRVCKRKFDAGEPCEGMTQERIDMLNSIGFQWVVGHVSNDMQWEANFNELLEYKQRYGTLNVSSTYPSKTLKKWVQNQRARKRLLEQEGEGKAKGMTWARKTKLDAIGFVWDGKM
jgi:hypothetical protein